MSEPLEGQNEILRHGTAAGEPPLLDTLASFARTALTDKEGLPPSVAVGLERAERRATDPGDDPYLLYAVDCLDDIIDLLNPGTETLETLAASVRILGRHLAERADVLRAVDADERDAHRYRFAANRIDEALDLVDEGISELLEGERAYPDQFGTDRVNESGEGNESGEAAS